MREGSAGGSTAKDKARVEAGRGCLTQVIIEALMILVCSLSLGLSWPPAEKFKL